eukprot:8981-Eustigmatos_ZCMA.PRE.1
MMMMMMTVRGVATWQRTHSHVVVVTYRDSSNESSKTNLQRQLDKLALALFGVAVVLGFVVVAVNKF